ncbi:hypothetical protein QTP88_026210 [Uroleucon formosanum]
MLVARTPPHRRSIVVSYTFMRSGKRDQTIYYLYTILCILYYAYTTGLISMEITPLFNCTHTPSSGSVVMFFVLRFTLPYLNLQRRRGVDDQALFLLFFF